MRWLGRLRTGYTALAIFCLNMAVVFAALNAVAWWFHPSVPDLTEAWPGLRRNLTAFAYPELSPADVDILTRETMQRFQYEPYTEIRERPLDGRFFHVDAAGFRRTKDQGPWPPRPDAYNLFLFGGSTAFGYGVVDDDTVASFLQPLLPPVDGRPVRVYNFGRCGYYSTQERILFGRLVTAGTVPDAAVFVDGLNDFSAPDDRPYVGWRLALALEDPPSPLSRALELFPLTTTVRHALRALEGGGETYAPGFEPVRPGAEGFADSARADQVIDRWVRSMRLIEGMGDAAGVATAFVWQPIPSYEFPAGRGTPKHQAGANAWAGYAYPRMLARVTATPLGPRFLWCADVAREGTQAYYIDAVHYAPVLAKRVAECIASGLRERGLLRARPR